MGTDDLQDSIVYENCFHIKSIKSNNSFIVFIICLALLLCVGRYAFFYVYSGIYVEGSSMNETLKDGDCLYANKRKEAKRGDIIVIDVAVYREQGLFSSEYIIKRLIGVAGDKLYCSNGIVYIMYSGTSEYTALSESYVSSLTPSFDEITVGEGEIFFLGDNRSISKDSTEVGCLKESDIYGVVTEWSIKNKTWLSYIF